MKRGPDQRLSESDEDCLSYRWQARLGWRPCDPFFPFGLFEAAGLEEGEGDHGHQAMSVQANPRSPFEMVEAETGFQFPVVVLDAPPDLPEPDQLGDRRGLGEGGEPVVGGLGGVVGPFDEEPAFGQ